MNNQGKLSYAEYTALKASAIPDARLRSEVMRSAMTSSGTTPSTGSVNSNRLRHDLKYYYGTASFNALPAAAIDLLQVEQMDTSDLCRKAAEAGFDLSDYQQ